MIEILITTESRTADMISDQLTELGALAVTFQDAGDQPIYEPKPGQLIEWDKIHLSALFEEGAVLAPVFTYLVELENQQFLLSYKTREIHEQEWLKNQYQSVSMSFGKRLWICPTDQPITDINAVNVAFNPGLAFGTGSHPTTALCLEWLDENIHGGETIIDYGCGSGILAVAALKLGATHAIGVDHDPQALFASQMNAELNQFSAEKIHVCLPENLQTPPVDILLANILANPLIELAPHFAQLLKPNGKLILSGIMIEQHQEVVSAYQKWFAIDLPVVKDEWVRLDGRRIS